MNRKQILLVIIAFLLGAAITFTVSKQSNVAIDDRADHPDHANETTWTCSMHPQIKLPEFGDCPICGMDLIPLEPMNSSDGSDVDLSFTSNERRIANVRTETVRYEQPRVNRTFLGELDWDESSFKTQSAWFGGRIESMRITYVGQAVRRGMVIATIYSPELLTAAEELRQAESSGNERLIASVNRKLTLLGMSELEITKLRTIRSDRFVQRAMVSGIVTTIIATEGSYVNRGGALLTVASDETVWGQIELYEKDLAIVTVGDTVDIVVPNSFFTSSAEVTFIDPTINRQTRTARARIELENRDGKLKPGMLVEATVNSVHDEKQLLVPSTSFLFTGSRAVIYLKKDSGFKPVTITVGTRFGDDYAVMGDIHEGDTVVTNGAFRIDAARQIQALPSMMYPDGGAPDPMAGMDMGEQSSMASMDNEDRDGLSSEEGEWMQSLYDIYLVLHENLQSDKTESAETALSMMNALMSPPNRFATSEENSVMIKLHEIKADSEISEVRIFFTLYSNWFIPLIESTGFVPTEGGSIYFCPMANHVGGEWIQKDGDVKNPYYGAMMLNCGEQNRPIGGFDGD